MGIEGKHFYRFTYLKSEEWRSVRLLALVRDQGICRICGAENWSNDAHHIRYPRGGIWKTAPTDLVTLCRKCHDQLHKVLGKKASNQTSKARSSRRTNSVWRQIKKKFKLATGEMKRLCFVCGWQYKQSEILIPLKIYSADLFFCEKCLPQFRIECPYGIGWKAVLAYRDRQRIKLADIEHAKRLAVSYNLTNCPEPPNFAYPRPSGQSPDGEFESGIEPSDLFE